LSKDDIYKDANQILYKLMIGSLLYVTASIPDVIQEFRQVEIFQAPKETHVMAVNWLFRYIKGTEDYGLWYPKGNYLSLIAYIDVD
jgi:hypothetical protein